MQAYRNTRFAAHRYAKCKEKLCKSFIRRCAQLLIETEKGKLSVLPIRLPFFYASIFAYRALGSRVPYPGNRIPAPFRSHINTQSGKKVRLWRIAALALNWVSVVTAGSSNRAVLFLQRSAGLADACICWGHQLVRARYANTLWHTPQSTRAVPLKLDYTPQS